MQPTTFRISVNPTGYVLTAVDARTRAAWTALLGTVSVPLPYAPDAALGTVIDDVTARRPHARILSDAVPA